MSERNPLARKSDSPTPVTARRVVPEPAARNPDPGEYPVDPSPPPPQQVAHVIYIHNHIPPRAAAPADDRERRRQAVRDQASQLHLSFAARSAPAPRSGSALGIASIALAAGAYGCTRVHTLGKAAVPVAAVGAALAILGWLGAKLLRRTSTIGPTIGLLLCLGIGGYALFTSRDSSTWLGELRHVAPSLPQIQGLPNLPALHSGGNSSPPPPSVNSEAHTSSGSASKTPSPAPTVSSNKPSADPAVLSARQRLAAAEQAFTRHYQQTSEYQAAKQNAQTLSEELATLRDANPNGGATVEEASRRWLDAKNHVQELLDTAMREDPTVAAAREALYHTEHPGS